MKKNIFILSVVFAVCLLGRAYAAEPLLADYTSFPIFTVNPVKPNILLIMDNSGSMNFNAYGTWPGNGGTVFDQPYSGVPYTPTYLYSTAGESQTAEEIQGTDYTYNNSNDLDLGYNGSNPALVGLRFTDVHIPQGAVISNAHIEFTSQAADSGSCQIDIFGEKNPRPESFPAYEAGNLSGRPYTSANVTWSIPDWTAADVSYSSPDITSIVQELVDDTEWREGNPMVFIMSNHTGNTNTRRAYSHEGTTVATRRPILYIEYVSPNPIKYYGYFSPDWF